MEIKHMHGQVRIEPRSSKTFLWDHFHILLICYLPSAFWFPGSPLFCLPSSNCPILWLWCTQVQPTGELRACRIINGICPGFLGITAPLNRAQTCFLIDLDPMVSCCHSHSLLPSPPLRSHLWAGAWWNGEKGKKKRTRGFLLLSEF